MHKTSMMLKIISIISLFVLLQLHVSVAQTSLKLASDSIESPHTFGVNWNTASLLNNYPSFLLSAQYIWKNKLSVELGAGQLIGSEIFTSSDLHTQHKSGFRLVGDLKYYFDGGAHKNGPYVGVGYSHIESTFQANYITRVPIEDQRYYEYVDEEYFSQIDQFYAKIGYRVLGGGGRFFFETGINLGFKVESLTPEPSNFGGVLVTNKRFIENRGRHPLPFSVDLKMGIMIFK